MESLVSEIEVLSELNMGYFGKSLRINLPSAIPYARLCTVDIHTVIKQARERSPASLQIYSLSSSFDMDWSRVVKVEPSSDSNSPKSVIYRRVCPVEAFESVFEGAFNTPSPVGEGSIFTSTQAMDFRLRTYHAVPFSAVVSFLDDTNTNMDTTFFPEGVIFEETLTSLKVFDPVKAAWIEYSQCSHSGDCRTVSDESAIVDTIVIGESITTLPSHGGFQYQGRVRHSDGLVVLQRKPADPNRLDLGTWILRGYMHEAKELVGDWRPMGSVRYSPGTQGWFYLSRNFGVHGSE